MRSRLLVISHTEHYKDVSGNIVGWGPTVRELNYLAKEFEHIYHIACFYQDKFATPSSVRYASANITFVPIPPVGGAGIINKLKIILFMPVIIYRVMKYVRLTDAFQFRSPTSIGIYVIPVLTLFTRKKGWFKYAGNWVQRSPPFSYAFQRFWLKYCQRRTVTINGKWKNQPSHCFSFENPCLTEEDRERGLEALNNKKYTRPLIASFAGRLEDSKGVITIIEALKDQEGIIDEMHFIGNGEERVKYEAMTKHLNVKVVFHGFLGRDEIFDLFSKSHLFLLPSTASEGFPKVIAEAANFGCVPVVSDVSSIPQYVSKEIGFVWEPGKMSFSDFFKNQVYDANVLKEKAVQAHAMAADFTFLKYRNRIVNLFFQGYA